VSFHTNKKIEVVILTEGDDEEKEEEYECFIKSKQL